MHPPRKRSKAAGFTLDEENGRIHSDSPLKVWAGESVFICVDSPLTVWTGQCVFICMDSVFTVWTVQSVLI